MGEIHKLRVKSPYELMKIVDIKIENRPNEHGYLYLKCLIDESVNFNFTIKAHTEDKICVYEEMEDTNDEKIVNINEVNERNSKRLFYGMVQNIRTTNVNGVYYLEIQALTSSSKLDIKEKSRSFQNVKMTYDALISEILGNYSGFTFAQNVGNGQKINKPIFQYKETDWNFLKRIASELKAELYCDIINFNYMFNFGIHHDQSYELNDNVEYDAFKDIESFYEAGGYNAGYDDTDFFYYQIEARDIFEVGSKIHYKQKDLYVREYEAYKEKEELLYKYKLCRKYGIWQNIIYNKRLKGATLEGKVLAVKGELVKLHLDIDENQNKAEAHWFAYAPPSVNIMYSMPLVSEIARLYFPNESSEAPIVTGCVRKNGDTCEGTADTRNRYFHTEHGSEIAMLPDALNIKGGSNKALSISFDDKSGVKLKSHKGLRLNADGEIVIKTHKRVKIKAQSQILMTKGNKSHGISIEGEFHVKGNNVITNGSSRETYAPFAEGENDDKGRNISFEYVQKNFLAGYHEKQTGWIQDGDSWYYFDPSSGEMVTNKWEQDSNGNWYYLGSDGKMVTDKWEQDSGGNWYYLGPDGKMVTNKWEQDSSGNWYYLGSDGKMVTDKWEQDSSGSWYYLGSDGKMVTNKWEQDSNGNWYYLGSDGKMVTDKWEQDSSDNWYYLGSDGKMVTDKWEQDSKGNWYYLSSDGKMANTDDSNLNSEHNAIEALSGAMAIAANVYSAKDSSVKECKILVGAQVESAKSSGNLNSNSKAQTGWIKDADSIWQYFDYEGHIATGWMKQNDAWYYFNSDGKMQTGWQKYDGKWYHLDDNGNMQTGWKAIDGNEYYFDPDGKMVSNDWIQYKDDWYYLDSNGKMQTGWVDTGGKQYHLDPYGKMETGWKKLDDNQYYYFCSDGEMASNQWVLDSDGYWYYLGYDGKMQTGWQKDNGKWYHLDDSGKMQTGWKDIEKTWYHFWSNGEMQTGWVTDGKLWYYYDDSTGKSQIEWIKDNKEKWYYLNSDHTIKTNWQEIDGIWYYFEPNGEMKTGWIQDSEGKWYYYDKSSGESQTGWIKYNNNWYYLYSERQIATGWAYLNGSHYYFNSDGEMQTGWIQDNGYSYYLDDNGIMAHDTTIDGCYVNANGEWEPNKYNESGNADHVCYIFYQPNIESGDKKHSFYAQAKIEAEKYKIKYPGTEVILVPVTSPHDFKDEWNKMDDKSKNIDAVQIILHGSIDDDPNDPNDTGSGYMYFENEWTKRVADYYRIATRSNVIPNNQKEEDILISDLDKKKMNELYFSSCNSANPDAGENTATAFEDVADANEITGWDGGTVYQYDDEEPTNSIEVAGGEGGYEKFEMKFTDGCGWHLVPTETKGQPTWWKYVEKDEFGNPVRERKGRVKVK
ncbi:toxin A [Clostridium saccharobutylicum]|nr:toxin A [Clostridium saccharobutylicum]NYC28934.1 glucan-binding YG repeat protein [Clostridium saccharobutylicum]